MVTPLRRQEGYESKPESFRGYNVYESFQVASTREPLKTSEPTQMLLEGERGKG